MQVLLEVVHVPLKVLFAGVTPVPDSNACNPSGHFTSDPEDWRERGGRVGSGMGRNDKPGRVGGERE